MLDNDDNKNISIQNCYQETFTTFMLALWLFIILSLHFVYLKVIPKIRCYILYE